jgi:Uma2 family endonuclease
MSGMATVPRPLSYQDWLAMPPAAEGREEVVRGELHVFPPNKYTHAAVIHNLSFAISSRVDRKQIAVLESSVSLMIEADPLTCRAPDLVVYWRENLKRNEEDVLVSAPDLVIEILSPSETKRRKQAKLEDYARIGVPEAWIVSPEAQHIEVKLLRGGRLELEKIVADGELQPARFPALRIPVAEIWPDSV